MFSFPGRYVIGLWNLGEINPLQVFSSYIDFKDAEHPSASNTLKDLRPSDLGPINYDTALCSIKHA